MIQTRIVDDVAQLEALRGAWRDLLGRSVSPQPSSTPLWLLAWWRQFGAVDGRKLRVVVVEDEGQLIGLAPLSLRTVKHRGAIPIRRLELLATGEDEKDEICSDYVGLVVARGRETEVTRAVADALVTTRGSSAIGAWDELVMPMMSSEDATVEWLRGALAAKGAKVTVTPMGGCPHIPLPASFDDYLKALDGSRRYVVARATRELEKWAGKDGYALVRASTPEELAEGRRILHSLHGERWSGEGESGVFASERFTRFHDEVMPALLAGGEGADGGSLDLLWLTVKGEPVAAVYNIVYGNKVYFYQSGRKLDVPKQVKIGIAMHALALKRSMEAGHREYDFLNGQSQYKRQLALATRPLVVLRAVAPTLRARAVDAARSVAERMVAEVRKRRAAPEPAGSAGGAGGAGPPGKDAPEEAPG